LKPSYAANWKAAAGTARSVLDQAPLKKPAAPYTNKNGDKFKKPAKLSLEERKVRISAKKAVLAQKMAAALAAAGEAGEEAEDDDEEDEE
jgi:hypothetical protein